MSEIVHRLKSLFAVHIILLIVYTICRLVFFAYNQKDFDFLQPYSVSLVFINGIRFDLTAILLSNLIFILLYIIPSFSTFKMKWYQSMLKFIFISVNSIFISLNLIDVAYFPFVQKRLQNDALLFASGDKGIEALLLIPTFLVENWILCCIFLLLLWSFGHFYNKITQFFENSNNESQWLTLGRIGSWVCAVGLVIIGIRGGLQLRPINVLNASSVAGVTNAPFVLNSTFSLIKTWSNNTLQEKKYFEDADIQVCEQVVKTIGSDTLGHDSKMNVVILIVESLSKQYMEENNSVQYTPFLDSLKQHSLVFTNGFANARESVQGIPAVLASLPSWMDDSFIFSRYSTNQVHSFGNILGRKGYETSFFHGATTGSMGFYAFTQAAGFQYYFGKEDYPDPTHFDGSWGIWDHHFLPFMADKLKGMKQPFVSSVLTVNTHHPFKLPKEFKPLHPSKKFPILNTIQYIDHTLAAFFQTIKNEAWYNNTIFIITADHIGPKTTKNSTSIEDYSVPIIFFKPDNSLTGTNEHVMGQIDIMPTLLSMILPKEKIFTLGRNVLDVGCPPFVLNYKSGIYYYTNDDYHVYFDGTRAIAMYEWKKDLKLKKNLINEVEFESTIKSIERDIKISIQNFHYAVIRNKMISDAYQ